ncbi:MAG: hypothetical protein AAGC67_18855 [Myxococcota bacterium]
MVRTREPIVPLTQQVEEPGEGGPGERRVEAQVLHAVASQRVFEIADRTGGLRRDVGPRDLEAAAETGEAQVDGAGAIELALDREVGALRERPPPSVGLGVEAEAPLHPGQLEEQARVVGGVPEGPLGRGRSAWAVVGRDAHRLPVLGGSSAASSRP